MQLQYLPGQIHTGPHSPFVPEAKINFRLKNALGKNWGNLNKTLKNYKYYIYCGKFKKVSRPLLLALLL